MSDIVEAVVDLRKARRDEENPNLKLFRVLLDGTGGVKVDRFVVAGTMKEAIEGVLENVCSMRANDFDRMCFEIDPKEFGFKGV